MSKIKFRGKGFSGKWITGYFTYFKDVAKIINASGIFDVLPDTVGQYTGLHDRVDKEIYEGDIVIIRECLYIIVYSVKWGRFLAVGVAQYKNWAQACEPMNGQYNVSGFNGDEAGQCEVAGNIYDNPELNHIPDAKKKGRK